MQVQPVVNNAVIRPQRSAMKRSVSLGGKENLRTGILKADKSSLKRKRSGLSEHVDGSNNTTQKTNKKRKTRRVSFSSTVFVKEFCSKIDLPSVNPEATLNTEQTDINAVTNDTMQNTEQTDTTKVDDVSALLEWCDQEENKDNSNESEEDCAFDTTATVPNLTAIMNEDSELMDIEGSNHELLSDIDDTEANDMSICVTNNTGLHFAEDNTSEIVDASVTSAKQLVADLEHEENLEIAERNTMQSKELEKAKEVAQLIENEEQMEAETLEQEKLDKQTQEKLKQERLKQEQEILEKERLEKERLENERLEKERLEKERLQQELAEQEMIAKELAEKERLQQELAAQEKARLEVERLEKERLEKELAAKEKLENELAAKEKLEKELAEKEKLAEELANQERVARELAEKEQLEQELAEKAEQQQQQQQLEQNAVESQESDSVQTGAKYEGIKCEPLKDEPSRFTRKRHSMGDEDKTELIFSGGKTKEIDDALSSAKELLAALEDFSCEDEELNSSMEKEEEQPKLNKTMNFTRSIEMLKNETRNELFDDPMGASEVSSEKEVDAAQQMDETDEANNISTEKCNASKSVEDIEMEENDESGDDTYHTLGFEKDELFKALENMDTPKKSKNEIVPAVLEFPSAETNDNTDKIHSTFDMYNNDNVTTTDNSTESSFHSLSVGYTPIMTNNPPTSKSASEVFSCFNIHFLVKKNYARPSSYCPINEDTNANESLLCRHIASINIMKPKLACFNKYTSLVEKQFEKVVSEVSELEKNIVEAPLFKALLQISSPSDCEEAQKQLKQCRNYCRQLARARISSQLLEMEREINAELAANLAELTKYNNNLQTYQQLLEDSMNNLSECVSEDPTPIVLNELEDVIEQLQDDFEIYNGLSAWTLSSSQSQIMRYRFKRLQLQLVVSIDNQNAKAELVLDDNCSASRDTLKQIGVYNNLASFSQIEDLPELLEDLNISLGRLADALDECALIQQEIPTLSMQLVANTITFVFANKMEVAFEVESACDPFRTLQYNLVESCSEKDKILVQRTVDKHSVASSCYSRLSLILRDLSKVYS